MTDNIGHEDYIKLSDKIDGLCSKTQDSFDHKIGKAHDRIDEMHDNVIRHDERLKTMEKLAARHMVEEDKRWKLIIRALFVLGLMHVLEFATSFPEIVTLLKSIGL